ncbi:hypothetical protein K439DRAFT_1657869 [Ramaria rubella]|nr:hypothetical protein K439DRAFT_1657869 [Ramaria rubella]
MRGALRRYVSWWMDGMASVVVEGCVIRWQPPVMPKRSAVVRLRKIFAKGSPNPKNCSESFAEIGGENLRIASQNICEITVPNSKISQKFCEKPLRRIWVVGTFRKSDFAGAEQALTY